MSTDKSATLVTSNSGAGTRQEILVTRTALNDWIHNRKRSKIGQFWVVRPELPFCDAVTNFTQSYQVIQMISLPVIVKQAKRANVVNRKILFTLPATLTSIVVSMSGFSALFIPVGATIRIMAAAPRGIVSTRPVCGRAPCRPALAITEIMFLHGARLFFDLLAACMALNSYPFLSNTLAMCLLPG